MNSSNNDNEPYWRVTPGFDPAWKEWEGEWLVYDRDSGSTHLFDELTVALIQVLMQGPAPQSELGARILADGEEGALQDVSTPIRQRLEKLSELQLVIRR